MPASVLSLNFQYLELHWQLSYAVKVPHSMNLEKQTHRSVPRDNLSSHERSLLSTPIYQAEVTAAHVHNLRLCFWRDAKYPPVLPALDPDHGEVQLIVPPSLPLLTPPFCDNLILYISRSSIRQNHTIYALNSNFLKLFCFTVLKYGNRCPCSMRVILCCCK